MRIPVRQLLRDVNQMHGDGGSPADASARRRSGPGLPRRTAKARGVSRRLSSCAQRSRAWTCDSTVYHSTKTSDAGVLVVGDAASFVEPLPSAGVRKAITFAWRAAVLVNTCLSDAGMSSVGRDYFDQRERAVYSECVHRAGGFFSAAATHYRTDFWESRATGAATVSRWHTTRSSELRDSVRRAFQWLRKSPSSLRFVAATDLQFAPAPEIAGHVLTMQEGVRPDELLSALALLVATGVLVPKEGLSLCEAIIDPDLQLTTAPDETA